MNIQLVDGLSLLSLRISRTSTPVLEWKTNIHQQMLHWEIELSIMESIKIKEDLFGLQHIHKDMN